MQLEQVNRLGIPIHWNEAAKSVYEYEKTVTVFTTSGREFTGDLCIGANGVASKIPGFDAGPDAAVQDSGYAIARVAFPRSSIKKGSVTSTLLKNVDSQPEFRVYVGKDIHLILFLTPDWVAFALTHPDLHEAKETWSNFKDSSELVAYLEKAADDWDPAVLDFVRSAPPEIVDWKLKWRDSPEQWTSDRGRLVRIGDSAHAFFPTAGNGAVQGIEDAVSLAECIRIAGRDCLTKATKVHNKLRFQRVSILQQTGFVNREELHTTNIAATAQGYESTNIGFFKIGRWVWNHNPEHYARDNYMACLAHIESGVPFLNTNLPPGHTYRPWSMESETKRMQAGIRSDLKENGDWSA
ncbi:hypothetical protein PISL3812_02074 [Talaromyces islandicus]|uniref:FAD-binding domain-containing protein n=1 Tax=Talaromyces islandicus TaxID=28573 RepID=A0A0U1LNV3_TALIS|nr:hypothetical protein PISL3812_02074 [Talaromyces islandicus]